MVGDYGEELLQAAESQYGEGAPKHAFALNLHSVALHRMGRYAEAEPLYRQVLEIDEKSLETNPLAFLTSLNNLAGLLIQMRHYAAAEVLYQQGVVVATERLGAEHPFTRRLSEDLGACRGARGASLQGCSNGGKTNGAP